MDASPAAAVETPAPLWRDLAAVGVTCLVHTPRGIDTGRLHTMLCDAVRTRAAVGAPVPVTVDALGGAALRPGTVTLLAQANMVEVAGRPVMALTIRTFRNDGGEAAQLFAAPPRAVAANDRAALDAAVDVILSETLPWRATHAAAPRPVPAR